MKVIFISIQAINFQFANTKKFPIKFAEVLFHAHFNNLICMMFVNSEN